jgi:Glycosyl Hydrolase Family 88
MRPSTFLAVAAVATAAAALVAGSAGAGHAAAARAPLTATIDDFAHGSAGWTRIGRPLVRTHRERGDFVLTLAAPQTGAAGIQRRLPAGWTVSFDLRLARGARAELDLGGAGTVVLPSARVRTTRAPGGWYRVEAATRHRGAQLDGRPIGTSHARAAGRLAIRIVKGSLALRALIAAPPTDRGALLLERLAWLHTRTTAGTFPIGLGADNRLHFGRGWTRGFWPGALWQAYDLSHEAMFERWALAATRRNFGREHADSHDLGFMYERSSVKAYQELCTRGRRPAVCARLRRSALTAAGSLLKLAATNRALGTIPTSSKTLCRGCSSLGDADTIVDSVMNLPLLFWASDATHDPRYRSVAARHARIVARMMVRRDGSTWASMVTRRSDGAFLRYDTHQGYRPDTTWARGQAWAIYGFAYAANALRDRRLLATAESTAGYVMRRVRRPAVPRYDYDAPAGAPRDVSAAVIGAAGMLRLAAACEHLGAACRPGPGALRAYAHGLLGAALAGLRARPPLGLLSHQVYALGGATSWDDDAELIFGVDFALEALAGGA